MDKLKKAVAKARATPSEQMLPPGGLDDAMTVTDGFSNGSSSPRYTQTRRHSVSSFELRQRRVLCGREPESVDKAYRLLRTQVLQKMNAHGWNSLAVVSAGHGDGKSLTAVNLAISMAREVNHTVLLADFDLGKPSLHKFFAYEPEFGLGDYLEGKAPLSDVLFNPGQERLVVLPGRLAVANSSETLSSPPMVSLVAEIKQRYDSRMIIFDVPPLLTMDDMLVFSPYVDAVLLVVAEGKTQASELQSMAHLLGDKPVLGMVLNQPQKH